MDFLATKVNMLKMGGLTDFCGIVAPFSTTMLTKSSFNTSKGVHPSFVNCEVIGYP
tara:strand:+ start:665 stop:832 length:168 start_codon:yes stop_codon:yes gene_type:complete